MNGHGESAHPEYHRGEATMLITDADGVSRGIQRYWGGMREYKQ